MHRVIVNVGRSRINGSGRDGPLPDFIIIGAMKAGTTFLHHLLAAREDVFMPRAELFFFDADEVIGHHAFSFSEPQAPHRFDGDIPAGAGLDAYRAHFAAARPDQLIGEDTTTYLASARAPRRIKALLPQVKLIALLRNPVDRAYSQYWHLVRSGMCFMSFEKALRYQQGTMLSRGCYWSQLTRYYSEFPDEQIHVLAFEDLIADTRKAVDGVCRFLGIAPVEREPAGLAQSNKGEALRFARAALIGNYLRATLGRSEPGYRSSLRPAEPGPGSLAKKLVVRQGVDYPPMRARTRRVLSELYRVENEGLDRLVGQDLSVRWFEA